MIANQCVPLCFYDPLFKHVSITDASNPFNENRFLTKYVKMPVLIPLEMHKGLLRVYTVIYKDIFSKKRQPAILGIHKGLKKLGKKIENLLFCYILLSQ